MSEKQKKTKELSPQAKGNEFAFSDKTVITVFNDGLFIRSGGPGSVAVSCSKEELKKFKEFLDSIAS